MNLSYHLAWLPIKMLRTTLSSLWVKLMMPLVLLLPLILFAVRGNAQNLITNPDFEQHYMCPPGIVYLGPDVRDMVVGWSPATHATPDYFNTCSTSPSSSVPYNLLGYQQPHSGNGYIGLICNYYQFSHNSAITDVNEFVMQKLTQPLTAGGLYKLEFYVSATSPDTLLEDYICFATSGIGALLTKDSLAGGQWMPLAFTPQLQNPATNIITDTAGWTKISGYFVADSERYITIGNYRKNRDCNYLLINPGADTMTAPNTLTHDSCAYLYLDDVSLTVENVTPATADITLCDTPDHSFPLTAVGGCTGYLWSTADTSQTIQVQHAGNYWYTAHYNGQLISDTIRVHYYVRHALHALADTAVCAGTMLTLRADTGYLQYDWRIDTDPGMISYSNTYSVQQAGTVYMSVTDRCGKQYDTVNVVYNPIPPLPVVNDTTVCQGSLITHLPVTGAQLTWYTGSPDTGTVAIPLINTNTTTPTTLYVSQTANGCTSLRSAITIYLYDRLTVTLTPLDTSFCTGMTDSLRVHTNMPASILWSTGDTSFSVLPAVTGVYTVTAKDMCESVAATATIKIEDCGNTNNTVDCTIKIPNAFTPDGDGVNDLFAPIITCPASIAEYSFSVYNRWGNRVFYTEDLNQHWNGEKASKDQDTEVYLYMLKVRYAGKDATVFYKGNVTILR